MITNRIDALFQRKKNNILSVYFTAGHPRLESVTEITTTLDRNGVDLIEIGIPFSDPMADGSTIQKSSLQALRNGMSLSLLFRQLANIRQQVDIPLILMGYLNPIMQFGFEAFCKQCSIVGIDGVIIPDLPFEEYTSAYKDIAEKHNIHVIMLITPETSQERIHMIDQATGGFIYMVSSASTTGIQSQFNQQKEEYFARIQAMKLKNPTLIGFGISNKQTFDSALQFAQGAIVGSKFVSLLETTQNTSDAVNALLTALKE